MASDWIEKRFKEYQKRAAKQEQAEQWSRNAVESYDAMFDALKTQVEKDVRDYNQYFKNEPDCQAAFRELTDGFGVSRQGVSDVMVSKTKGPIIKLQV